MADALTEMRRRNSPLYGAAARTVARRNRLHAIRKRRAAELQRKHGVYGVSVTLHSLPFELKIDVREVGRAARDLELLLPVDVRVIPLEEHERHDTRNGYWTCRAGRHQIFLARALREGREPNSGT